MTPIVKDPENAAAPTAPSIPAAPASNASARPQPVALEVPVTVNGARSVDGSDKREPFSERSQTVLVFGHGAVLRISALLAPGQLVFLTNEKSKKEVVCVVVKSKTDGNAVGYVELRFTEPAPGFWGMRFPSDTVLPQAATRPGTPAPVAAKPPAVVPPAAVKPIAAVPSAPAGISPEIPKIPAVPTHSASPVSLQASPVADAAVPSVASSPLFAPADSKPVKLASSGLSSASSNQSTDELKQQAARLQEQLSSLLFAEAPKPAASTPPALEGTTAPELAKKVLDLTNFSSEPVGSLPVKSVPPPSKPGPSSLEVEEIKIPSWLAPLARESETQTAVESSQELSNSFPELEAVAAETPENGFSADAQEFTRRPEVAIFGGQLLGDSSQPADAVPSKSRTGLLLGIAASLLLIAGGVWYSRQPGNPISGILGGTSTASQPAVSPAAVSAPEPEVARRVTRSESAASKSSLTPTPVNPPAPVVTSAAKNTPPAAAPRSTNSIATPNAVSSPRSTPAVEEPKKPALGDVHLATPVINRGKASSTTGDSEPTIEISESTNTSVPVSGLGSSHRAEPAAPVPIGGDVKPAKLLKSVQPIYPSMAKSQHVSGNVQIDALIDADGNVSAMKVLSGPALLRESALASLKQWKYQPAELDGKPTSMHLTVTLQFRAQ